MFIRQGFSDEGNWVLILGEDSPDVGVKRIAFNNERLSEVRKGQHQGGCKRLFECRKGRFRVSGLLKIIFLQ